MGSRRRRTSSSGSGSSSIGNYSFLEEPEEGVELQWPFGRLDTLNIDEVRETAYEIFFACCRSSGSSGRAPAPRHGADGVDTAGRVSPGSSVFMSPSSRLKSTLGLRTRPATPMRTTSNSASPTTGQPAVKGKPRLMTSAEIMRHQMGFSEQIDTRLRKTFMRFIAGQVGRQMETIILPLEFLRHLKPSEFGDSLEYHWWQRRQLKVLEAGLLLYHLAPPERLHPAGIRLREIVASSELKPIDTSKHSEAMRNLCNSVMTLAWRYHGAAQVEVCHWADGFPLNVHLYLFMLRSIFDPKEETVVLDEVDELLELMKKTWPTLGISKMIHNVCLTWILFEQYVTTGLVETDLFRATLAMLDEVAIDAKRPDREPCYMRVLMPTMASLKAWAEKRLMDYHGSFAKDTVGMMENVLCLALLTAKIISEETLYNGSVGMIVRHEIGDASNFSPRNRVDQYIRTSVKSAFTKVSDNGNGQIDSMVVEVDEDPHDSLINLAKETRKLALLEKERYYPLLKMWHPAPAAIAAVTLHGCFGALLKQYIYKISSLTNELVRVLLAAGDLEKVLVQLATDSSEMEDGGKAILSEIISYDVNSVIFNLAKSWIDDRLRMGRECVNRAKESESWNPKSKQEPYAESAVDLMKLAKVTVDEFFDIQGAGDELAQILAQGLDTLFKDYSNLASSCGSKESYIPSFPPLTRCNQDSKVAQLWKKASAPCSAGVPIDPALIHVCRSRPSAVVEAAAHRHTTSRSTQRLYVRLNTLHHIIGVLHTIEKTFSSHVSASAVANGTPRRHFESTRSSVNAVALHIAKVAAHRLIFLDTAPFFYDSLYFGSVAGARIQSTLGILGLNLTYLTTVLIERAQPQVLREVMKASFEVFLTVLLAGGTGRVFARGDYVMVAEDLASLKRLFMTCGEGVLEEEVDKAAATAEGVVKLMGVSSDRLVEEFSIAACEASGLGRSLERVPMPPTTGRWHPAEPNTMLRVLCHRNDDAANRFLKRAFQLPKRK